MGTAMVIMAAGAIINIILDPLLITMMPERGPQAVAIATVISQLIQAGITLLYFLKKSPVVRFHGIRPAKKLIPEICSVGIPKTSYHILCRQRREYAKNMVESGARGSLGQMGQMAGIRGLMS